MQHTSRRITGLVLTGVAGVTLLGGCVYRRETVPAASPSTTVVVTQPEKVVNYPEGRYELRGAGTTGSPYYWVWIPKGATPPNPPPLPSSPVR